MRDSKAAGSAHLAHSRGAIIAHAGKDDADGECSAIGGDRFHGDVNIWQVAGDAAGDGIQLNAAERIYAKMLRTGADVEIAGLQRFSRFCFLDANFMAVIES